MITQTPLFRKAAPYAAALALTAFGLTAPSSARAADIVDTAAAAPQFSTLVAAVKAAGLVNTLKGAGPFTVFAPTNAAFAKLPAGTVKALLNNPKRLKAILTYHVIPGKITAKQVLAMKTTTSPPTVEGKTLHITKRGGTVMVNNAKVIKADIMADNGVIHAIDTVLIPGAAPSHGKMMKSGMMHMNR